MQAEKEDGRMDVGNSEPRSNNMAKWAYSEQNNFSGDNDINYAMAMAAGGPGIESSGLNINEVLNNDGLNDEIKKLLQEQS